ncbi:MFS transporter [Brevibacillus agri]|uniref:MFS transporter n=2 Tax=Brevibacillus agri TaxID=51101 RepID=A0A3M8ANG2_9BACL|nr:MULTISPECIES: MFS transporter [Brevibacillus]QHZ58517.1 MFS transporter [Brevibacillus sp. NSP2.1]EJL39168.1 arabinose efflux permease family protein [Brevibacillus sp. CF112]MBY0054962.1 MFS transporter [Brevibacillus agri]MED1689333.1 MFS transporter [Brevibacillus agri]MED1695109.1 MFS transporter [Brevibacillus agri]
MGESREKLWTKDFVLLTVCNMLLFLTIQMQTPTFPAYVKQAYQANDFVVSLVISLFSLAAVVARALTGEALRTKNSKVIAMLALCTVGIFSAGYYWAGHIALFLFLRVLVGIGFGMGSTAFPTVVSNVIPVRRIGEGMGYFGLSTSLAMALGPLIGLGILQSFGIGPMLLTLVLLVAAIFPLAHMIRSYSLRMAPAPKAAPVKGFARFFDKKLLLPVSLNFCLSITYGGILSFLALYGKETHIANVGWFFLANALAMILIRPFSGKLYDRKGHIAVLPPGAIFVGVSLLLLSVTTSESLLLISAFFYGLGYGMIQPSIQAWMVKVVAPEQRGMANGLFFNSIDLGIAAGSMLLGVLATHSSYSVMYRWSAACMLLFLGVYVLSQLVAAKGKKARLAGEHIGL